MLEWAISPVDAVSLRWLLQIVLLSLGLTLACYWGFRDDSRSRRSLGVAAIWLLALVPLLLVIWQPRYQIGMVTPPQLPEFAGIPLLLVVLWVAAAFIGCVSLLVQVGRASQEVHDRALLDAPATQTMCQEFCERIDLALPRLVVGEHCCASSIGGAALVVPPGFSGWPTTAQRSVIAHELVHLQRRDDRFMVALQLLGRCYVFCPWLRSLYQRFVHALEEACDERAAELVGERALYLEGLAEAALRDGGSEYARHETRESRSALVASLINAQEQNSLMQRLARLLGKQKFFEVQSGALAAGVSAGLLVLAVFTTFEFVQVPKRYVLHATPLSTMQLPTMYSTAPNQLQPTQLSHEVQVISKFPSPALRRTERVTPSVIYPGRALVDSVEGEVLIEFSIAADGTTVRSRVLRSTHPSYFDRAATRAVKQTVFAPLHNPQSETGFSGVNTAHDLTRAGELLAVPYRRVTPPNKVQKLFLFRLHRPRSE